MTTIMPNPTNVPEGVAEGYQRQNTILYMGNIGYNNIQFEPINRTILQGSVFEVNGHLARVIESEQITSGTLAPNNRNWLYAAFDNDGVVSYRFSPTEPVWIPLKGGHYHPTDTEWRAILIIITGASIFGNVLITGAIQISNIMTTNVPPNAGGENVYTRNVRSHEAVSLEAGWYRFVMNGGLGGGNGGNGSERPTWPNTGPGIGGGGGTPSGTAPTMSGLFFHTGGSIIVHVGGNGLFGLAGLNSDFGGGGGGGGGGAGEASYIEVNSITTFSTERIPAGNGGNGADNPDNNFNPTGGLGGIANNPGEDGQGGSEGSGNWAGTGGRAGLPNDAVLSGGGGGGGGGAGGSGSGTWGGSGGDGGRPGEFRPTTGLGSMAAGFINIFRLT